MTAPVRIDKYPANIPVTPRTPKVGGLKFAGDR
jgi:hypothetical protein